MDNLKAIIIQCFKEEDHIKSSSWMSGNIDIIITIYYYEVLYRII